MTLRSATKIGPYQVLEEVGAGGMATVYKAYQAALDRPVALKVLPQFYAHKEGFRERFKQEALAVAKLRHPNIIQVFDYGESKRSSYIVSEFLDGGTLGARLGTPMPLEEAIALLEPLASALDHAHNEGVLHRDVKPSNVMMNSKGVLVLTDFGLSKIIGADAHLTETGSVLGTPEYMSPEQCMGRELTPAADQYSLAVLAFQALTGRVPFDRSTPAAVVVAQVTEPLPAPSSINPELSEDVDSVFARALDKDPAKRYPTCSEFVQALRPAAPALALPRSRTALLATGVAILAVVVAGFAIWLAITSSQTPRQGLQVGTFVEPGQLDAPLGLAADGNHLYIADSGNNRVQIVSFEGRMTNTLATTLNPGSFPLADPRGVGSGTAGGTYIADTGHNRILLWSDFGAPIELQAGTGKAGKEGEDGPATAAQLDHPAAVIVDSQGTVLIADTGNGLIRVIARDGTLKTLAGGGQIDFFSGKDSDPRQLRLPSPVAIAADPRGGIIYIGDSELHAVIELYKRYRINPYAGNGSKGSSGDHRQALNAQLDSPGGLALDAAGNLYIADAGAGTVRRVDAKTQVITTVISGLKSPTGLAFDPAGNLYVAETGRNRILKIKLA